jgi:hypothetical protein
MITALSSLIFAASAQLAGTQAHAAVDIKKIDTHIVIQQAPQARAIATATIIHMELVTPNPPHIQAKQQDRHYHRRGDMPLVDFY